MLGETVFVWVGIGICLSQSAILSGLDLACFNTSKLRLRVEVSKGNTSAEKLLRLRRDSNFLLTTILWSNIAANVLLALLSNSVLAGVGAFIFSTVIITLVGEILPQAYFSRHAIRIAALFYPLLRFYQMLFYLVAKPSAWILDHWFGEEGVTYYHEKDLYELIKMHTAAKSEIGEVEGIGAMNFLLIDDLPVSQQGRPVSKKTVIQLPFENARPIFPDVDIDSNDPFLRKLHDAGRRWIVLIDESGEPRSLLDADSVLKDIFFLQSGVDLNSYIRIPVIIKDENCSLGEAMKQFKVDDEQLRHDTSYVNVILVWGKTKSILTGKEVLARLLRDIVQG